MRLFTATHFLLHLQVAWRPLPLQRSRGLPSAPLEAAQQQPLQSQASWAAAWELPPSLAALEPAEHTMWAARWPAG